MASKIFQANHQNQWLSTEVVGAKGLVTKPLEPIARMGALTIELLELIVKTVAPRTRLSTITIRVISQ